MRILSEKAYERYMKLESQVGNTSLYEIKNIPIPNGNRIFAKEEWENPTGSIFDRIYPHLFKIAEEEGKIVPELTPVIEASTGNAGASFAWCAKQLGYNNCKVIIHEDAPKVRVEQIKSYGAEIIYSPAGQYTKGYVQKLEEILRKDKEEKGGKIGENTARLYCVTKINSRAREAYKKLVQEVISKFSPFDYFVGVAGSGTSISGIGQYLKMVNPLTKVVAADPSEMPSTYYFKYNGKFIDCDKMPHNVWGGPTFGLPLEKLNLNLEIIDEVQLVTKEERENSYRLLSGLEGKQVGRTSWCAFAVAYRIAKTVRDKNILICFYDLSWKYDDNGFWFK